jgi:hypothetical protein
MSKSSVAVRPTEIQQILTIRVVPDLHTALAISTRSDTISTLKICRKIAPSPLSPTSIYWAFLPQK